MHSVGSCIRGGLSQSLAALNLTHDTRTGAGKANVRKVSSHVSFCHRHPRLLESKYLLAALRAVGLRNRSDEGIDYEIVEEVYA